MPVDWSKYPPNWKGKPPSDLIARFSCFSNLLTREPFLSSGELQLQCSGGGVSRCNARYEGNLIMSAPIVPPKGFQDKTGDLPIAFGVMVDHITGTGFSGAATLSVKVFLGKVYKIKVGFDQEWQGE